jgi:hypothetical protein
VEQLAATLAAATGTRVSSEVILLALAELAAAGLLEPTAAEGAARTAAGHTLPRRAMLRRLVLASGTGVRLPVVTSMVTPTPAMALSIPRREQEPPPGRRRDEEGRPVNRGLEERRTSPWEPYRSGHPERPT